MHPNQLFSREQIEPDRDIERVSQRLIVITAMSVAAWDISIAIRLSGYVGLAALILAALFSGAFIDLDSRRVDMATEGRNP
ncbi:DUF5316 domain-containing protein [Paenibacillus sp. MER TA 81-3]|nr:DUF5316 family protein [Paenibacillus sp. MER TA 81-3]MCM3340669.1 DUF5316 domain-containing protein [Paenibacillus sp. MER TA 81-3]